jgi:hypothetical protein
VRSFGDVDRAAVAGVVEQLVAVTQHQSLKRHTGRTAAQVDDAAARAAGAAERGAGRCVRFEGAGGHPAHQPDVLADDVELLAV